MSGILAATVANILASTPVQGIVTAYGLDRSFLFGVLQPTPKAGLFQIDVKTSGNTTAGSFAESATLTTAGAGAYDRVTLNQKRYYCTVAVDGLQEVVAKGGGVDQINDWIATETLGGIEDMLDAMNYDAITSGSVNKLNSVVYYNSTGAMSSTTATEEGAVNVKFGDKTRSGYYSAYVVSAATASLNIAQHMDVVHKELIDNRHSRYDEIWTSETQLLKYETILRNSGSFLANESVGFYGFKTLTYHGRPVIGIPGYKNDRMDFVQKGDWEFWFAPQSDSAFGNRELMMGDLLKIEELAKTTDDTTVSIICYANLICKNPYKQGAIVALATS